MPLQFPRLPRSLLYPRPIVFDGFRGLNMVDDPTQLPPGFSPECVDLLFNSEGQMRKRPAWIDVALPHSIPSPTMVFYWPTLDKIVYQDGAVLKMQPYPNGATTTITTFTTTGVAAAVDFNGKLVVVHPVDGVFDYDGTTWTSRSATVKGSCIAAWQNKLWVGGDTSNPSRVWASNAGSSATWTTASDFVDLREVDNSLVTAIGGGNGMDIAGRPGLMVFKATSWYRINSSNATTGFTYTTLSDKTGAVGPNAVASSQTQLVAVGFDGVYMSDGVNAPTKVSRLIEPAFRVAWGTGALPAVVTTCVATVRDGVFVFSLSSAGGTWSYDPLVQAWGQESYRLLGATVYAPTTKGARPPIAIDLNGNLTQAEPSTSAAIYTDFQIAPYKAKWFSPWVEPFQGRNSRLQTVRIRGNNAGAMSLSTLKDLTATVTAYPLSANAIDASHESFVATLHDLGAANMWQLLLQETTAGTTPTGWTDPAGLLTSAFLTQPPFQISQIAATFYLQGYSS